MSAQISREKLRAATDYALRHPSDRPERIAIDHGCSLAVARAARTVAAPQLAEERDRSIRGLARDGLSPLGIASALDISISVVRRTLKDSRPACCAADQSKEESIMPTKTKPKAKKRAAKKPSAKKPARTGKAAVAANKAR